MPVSEEMPSNVSVIIDSGTEEQQWLRDEIDNLHNFFNHKTLDAILRATKLSLDTIRKRVFFQS